MKQGQSSTPADILLDNLIPDSAFIAMIPIDCKITNFSLYLSNRDLLTGFLQSLNKYQRELMHSLFKVIKRYMLLFRVRGYYGSPLQNLTKLQLRKVLHVSTKH